MEVQDDNGTEICNPADDPTEMGAGQGVMLNAKIDNNLGLILDNLFGAMVQKDSRRERVVTEMKNQIQEIHDYIFNKIEDYQASTLEDASNGPMEQCYYEKSPEFEYSHTAFDQWKANYKDEIDSIAGIQRSHSDDSGIEHSDMYHAAEDLVDVYQQMVFDMVDHCKTDEAINECKAENNEYCNKQPNSEKGYHCECMDGFARKTESGPCEDIDECLTGEADCEIRSENLICKNLIGYQSQLDRGYTCLCKNGYVERSLSLLMRSIDHLTECNDDTKNIKHICDTDENTCPENALCAETTEAPFHKCSCQNGFAFFPNDSETHNIVNDLIPGEDQASLTAVDETHIHPETCDEAGTFLVKMDFTDAPTTGRKRRQVNTANNNAAMDRIRDALVALGIPQNDIVTKVFMQGEWRDNRSCELHRWQPVTQTQWNNLPAAKRINSFLFFTVAIRQTALDTLANIGIDINNCNGNNPQGTPCAALSSAMAAAALNTHNSCRSLMGSFTIWKVGGTQLDNWRQFIPNFVINPMFAPYGRKRRGADSRMGTKRVARRQKKSKKNKNKNPGGLRTESDTEISLDYADDIEYQSCDMKEFVDYKINIFKDFLLQKYNQFAYEELNETSETTMIFNK